MCSVSSQGAQVAVTCPGSAKFGEVRGHDQTALRKPSSTKALCAQKAPDRRRRAKSDHSTSKRSCFEARPSEIPCCPRSRSVIEPTGEQIRVCESTISPFLFNSIAITIANLSTFARSEHKSSAKRGGNIGKTVCGR